MRGPLDGLTVVDLSSGMPGALATMLLADNGARVIKVEPQGGDPFRSFPPTAVWSRGKQSVTLDLSEAEGRRDLLRLLDRADVLLESFRPGKTARLGIDYPSIKDEYPRLVYCSLTGYGQTVSERDRFGYDGLVQARTGLQWIQQGHREAPIFMGFAAPSYSGGFTASYGILAALHARAVSGRGQHVDSSLLGSTMLMQRWLWSDVVADAPEPVRLSIVRMLQCQDGEYLWVHTGARGSFERLVRVLDLAEFLPDGSGVRPDSTTSREEADRLAHKVEGVFASRPRAEWMEILDEADIPNRQVLYPGESFADEQVNAIGAVLTVDDPELGPLQEVAPPYRFQRTPSGHPGPAPRPGEHTAHVMAELSKPTNAGASRPTGNGVGPTQSLNHALEDLLIVDFGQFIAAPMAARLSADLGARVIRVEPVDGETMRPRHDRIDTLAKTFQQANAGKRGVALNLKDPEALAVAHKLMAKADIVVHNFRPGVVERLNIDYETAHHLKPDVIYCSCPGFGSVGPRRDKPGFEPLYAAFCGVQRNCGGVGNPPSQTTSLDQYCGLLAANAILMGLRHRDVTGEGQHIEVTQLAQVMYYTSEVFFKPDGAVGWDPTLNAEQTGYGPLNRLYRTGDGWVCICCWTEEERLSLSRALEMDPTQVGDGGTELADAFVARSTDEWAARLEEQGVPFEVPVMDGEGLALTSPEYLESGLVAEYPHPHWVNMRAPGVGVRLSETPGVSQGPAPLLGEHTREVMSELGYSADQIDDMQQRGVVGCTETGDLVGQATGD